MIAGYSVLNLLVVVIVVGAAVAITYVVLQQMGVAIPDWAVRIFWIVVICFVGIFALRVLFSM